jgi:hypothetical protein
MQLSSVTFVLAEAILRELGTKVTHHPIACHLGDHTGGSDAQADAITIDDCSLGERKRDYRQAVDQDVPWSFKQAFDCQAHSPMARP